MHVPNRTSVTLEWRCGHKKLSLAAPSPSYQQQVRRCTERAGLSSQMSQVLQLCAVPYYCHAFPVRCSLTYIVHFATFCTQEHQHTLQSVPHSLYVHPLNCKAQQMTQVIQMVSSLCVYSDSVLQNVLYI